MALEIFIIGGISTADKLQRDRKEDRFKIREIKNNIIKETSLLSSLNLVEISMSSFLLDCVPA